MWPNTVLSCLINSGIPIFRTFRGNEISSRNRRVRQIGGKIATEEGKQLLVRVIERLEKTRGSRNRDSTVSQPKMHDSKLHEFLL